MEKFYEIECGVLEVVMNELNKVIQELKSKEEIHEFNIILDDMLESIEVSIDAVKGLKINAGMTNLRNSFELIVAYVAIIKNEKLRANYMDVTKNRNIRSFSDEITKIIERDIYEEVYKMLCEFAHPTLLRNYFCENSKTEEGIKVNRNIGMFLLIIIIREYVTYLSVAYDKEEDFTLDSLIFLYFGAFIISLRRANADKELIKKYEILFGTKEQKEMLKAKQDELKNLIEENKEEITRKLEEAMNTNSELKMKLVQYVHEENLQ